MSSVSPWQCRPAPGALSSGQVEPHYHRLHRVPPNSHMEVLTPITWECDCFGSGLFTEVVNVKGGPYDGCPYEKRRLGQAGTEGRPCEDRENTASTRLGGRPRGASLLAPGPGASASRTRSIQFRF